MPKTRVTLQIEEGIAYVSLNRPDKLNALDMAMFTAIDSTIRQLKKAKNVRAVILSGAGDSFCSGLDIQSVMSSPSAAIKLLWKWLPGNPNLAQRVTVGWRELKVPVIAALHGKCWGGGMQIALGADYRIASPEASLAIMEARWGLIPDMGGTLALQELMSVDQAMKLAMTAEPVNGEQAKILNLVSQVAKDPMDAAMALANQLKERSPDTNKAIKKMYHGLWSRPRRKVLARETLNQWRILMGKNQRIAVKRAKGDQSTDFYC